MPPRFDHTWRDIKEVMTISFPVIIAMASHTVMGFVDTLMLSQYGKSEMAASGASGVIAFTFLAFIIGTSSCMSTFVSQSMGRDEPRECARFTWQGLLYFGLIAQALVLPIAFWSTDLFAVVGHDPEIQGLESSYFRIRMLHVAGTAAYASLSSFFQGIGRPGIPMVIAIVSNAVNILLDYLLIFGAWGCPEMGIAGAATATTISSYFQAGLLLAVFLSAPFHEAFATRTSLRFDLVRFRRFLAIGAPAGLNFMLDVASWAVFTNFLIGRLGGDVLAANTATHTIIALSFMPAVGMNRGLTVVVGQYIGRGDPDGALRRGYVGIGLASAYMLAMGILFVLFRRPLIGMFSTDANIIQMGGTMLQLAAIFQIFDALGIVSQGALRGAGDTRVPAVIMLASAWLVLLPLGYVLTFVADMTYIGAWAAAAIHIAIVGLVLLARFRSGAWRKIDIFEGVEPAS